MISSATNMKNINTELLNTNCKVLPLRTVILTFCDHNNGTNNMMIYTPRLPFNIFPARYLDQLSAVVLECRTVKTFRNT